jgi:carboxylesterase type B
MITIAGQSAGAASTHTHLLNARMSKVKPLFARAVLMSGSAGCLGPCQMEEVEERWEVLCEKLGVQGIEEERLKRLKSVSVQTLVDLSWDLGWLVWDSVIDNISMIVTNPETEVLVTFNNGDDNVSASQPEDQLLEVMIGETDNEVYLLGIGII